MKTEIKANMHRLLIAVLSLIFASFKMHVYTPLSNQWSISTAFWRSRMVGKGRSAGGLSAGGLIVEAVALTISVAITPTVVDAVQNMNTTGWTFTSAAAAKTILLLIPFVWICSLTVHLVLKLLGRI